MTLLIHLLWSSIEGPNYFICNKFLSCLYFGGEQVYALFDI